MFLTCTLAVLIVWMLWKYLNLPVYNIPGPRGWPIIGVTHKMMPLEQIHTKFYKWTQQYGPVMYLSTLNGPTVALSDFESIYEMSVKQGMLCGARMFGFRENFCFKGTGIVTSEEPDATWKSLRKVSHKHLKQFGEGMGVLETIIKEIGQDMFQTFSEKAGVPFDPNLTIFSTTLRNITFLMTGKTFAADDEFLLKFHEYGRLVLKYAAVSSHPKYMILDFFPWLRHLGYRPMDDLKGWVNFEVEIWEELKSFPEVQVEGQSLIHTLMSHIGAEDCHFNEVDVRRTVMMLFFAGTATTGNTFYASINILAHHPEIQDKLYEEILSVTKGAWSVELSNRPDMHYGRAFILELLRYSFVTATGVPHCNTEDTTILGYHIPKGTRLQPILYSLHHDEKFWTDPEEFRPERFLDDNGELVPADHPNRKHVMSFGAGPRVCLAESFAMARLFLWITNFVKLMKVVPAPGNDISSIQTKNYVYTGLLECAKFEIIFTMRE